MFLSFIACLLTGYVILKSQSFFETFWHDNDLIGKQKFHIKPVPRVGGVAIFLGLLVAKFPFWLVIASIPIFFGGLLEDLTKQISPVLRLIFSFISALLAISALDIGLQSFGWQLFDNVILSFPIISILITILIIGGISNSANIIDGFNGLLLGFSILALTIFAFVAYQVEDDFLFIPIITTIGALLGFFVYNFPKGLIFLGDGGAYLIGFLMAIFALILLDRHSDISPLFPILVLIYPIFELLFSIYRKRLLRGHSPLIPDGIHLHMLVYKRIVPQFVGIKNKGWKRNAVTSIIMILFISPTLILSFFFWESSIILFIGVVLFVFYYVYFYFIIIRFKSSNFIITKLIYSMKP